MKRNPTMDDGIRNLITYYRKAFQISENINHYSEKDFRNAERQFTRLVLRTRSLSDTAPQHPVPQ